MSRLHELISAFCPNGVAFKKLEDLLQYEQPNKYLVSSTDYHEGYPTPVLTAGQTFILGYTDETTGIYKASDLNPVIIFDDFTTAFKWVDFPFKAKSSAMKMITRKSELLESLRYAFYAMQTITYAPQDHARQWLGTVSKLQIPVPPLEVQREIVKILDKFTQLEAELEAELEARRRQYKYYRDALLNMKKRKDVNQVPLGEAAVFHRGTAITKKETVEGQIPVVANGPSPISTHNTSNRDGETVVVARSGAYAGYVSFWNQPIFLTDAFSVQPNPEILSPKFLYHLLRSKQDLIHSMKQGSGVPHVRVKDFESYTIPVPSIEEQERIVAVLDKFDALVNDISTGLPAEIKARRQQYEHYRDRLLTFKEAA